MTIIRDQTNKIIVPCVRQRLKTLLNIFTLPFKVTFEEKKLNSKSSLL